MPIKLVYFFLFFPLILISCVASLPQSESPLEIEKVFNTSFDKTWDSVLEVVKTTQGVVITNDKSSGLVTYTILDSTIKSNIYIQVYLKSSSKGTTITVFLFSRTRTGPYCFEAVEKDFFERLEKVLES